MNRLHLVRRFLGALRPGPPSPAATARVEAVLTPPELELWRHLPNHDRRYSVRVAELVERDLASTEYAGDPQWIAAALLHDTGKLDSNLGVPGRSVATIVAALAGRRRVSAWRGTGGFRGRVADYTRHDELGAARIRAAGGREVAAEWAFAHHHEDRWAATSIPRPVADVLRAADDA
jgi:hypothetical protein